MIMQVLGLADLIISAFLGAMVYGISVKMLAIIFGIYLLGKGAMFISSLASMIDIFAGIVLVSSYFFNIPQFVMVIAALLLLQKAIFSFF